MKHAYLIMAHTDFKLLEVLVSMLDDPRNDIYIHVDKKVPMNNLSISAKNSKIYILKDRIAVYWGHYSQIEAEMLLFETAFNKQIYSYYHLLSGVDLPIKKQDYIHHFFYENFGREFVGFWNNCDSEASYRVSYYHPFMKYERNSKDYLQIIVSKIRKLGIRIQNKIDFKRENKEIYWKKGPNWVSVTNEFCGYLLSKKEWIKERFKYTQNADEVFLQSIIWNSPYRERIYNPNVVDSGCMREIDWERGTITSPYTWRISDLNRLMSSDKLFARKFSNNIDKDIILRISEKFNNVCHLPD